MSDPRVITRFSCTLIRIEAMITWAQALINLGFFRVQIIFFLPAKMRKCDKLVWSLKRVAHCREADQEALQVAGSDGGLGNKI